MPKLSGPVQFTGTLNELVAYKTRNGDEVIVRKKPFVSKEAFKNEPQYAAMRRNSAEFAGCAYAGKMLRGALPTIMQLADYNMTPALNRFCKAIQKQDTEHAHGQRPILFSAYKEALTSIVFTKKYPFDTVLKQRPVAVLIRETAELHIQFSDLLPGFNFHQPWNKPHFRLIASLGVIKDLHYTENGYDNPSQMAQLPKTVVFGDWMLSAKKMSGHSMIIQLPEPSILQQEGTTLLGAMGIQMGQPGVLGEIEPLKYASTAKILVAG